MSTSENHREALDAATSKRLARLGEQPVNVSSIERRLDAAFQPPPARTPTRLWRWLSPAAGVAASLAIMIGVYFAVFSGGGEARAAVIELSQLHHDIASGKIALTPVESIVQANRWIASQAVNGPQLPGGVENARVQSCCLAQVRGDLVAVAVMEVEGQKVTLVVADAPDFAREMGNVIEINGRRYFGHQVDGVNMMMANTGNRWLCVMGDVDDHQLASIAARIRF